MEQDILNKISKEYGLSELSFVSYPENGISAHNVIVKTKDGSTYFIKNYKKTDAEKRDNSEYVEVFISKDNSIPVVLPIKNNNGEYHIIIEDQMYSVFLNILHKEYNPEIEIERNKLMSDLGGMLGKIHGISSKYSIPSNINLIHSWNIEEKEKSILELEKIKKIINNKDILDEFDIKALYLIELKISLLKESNFRIKEKEPTVVCHGDYHKSNILFNESGNIIGVCDWDISGKANPYIEFIRSYNMCVIRRDFAHYQEKNDLSKSFINGYINNCGFDFDLLELNYAIESWYQKSISTIFPLSDHYYFDHRKADSSVDSELDKINFLRENRMSLFDYIKSLI